MTVETVSVLTFVTELVRLHQAHRDVSNPPQLVAASITERERWIPVIRDVVEIEDGVLVDATALGEGVDCGSIESDAPLLLEWAQSMLDSYNALDDSANLELKVGDEHLTITGSMTYEASNAAQRAFREIVSAVCADSLRSSQLAVLMFAQDALDGDLLRVVWDGLMDLPARLGSDGSTTLSVIAGDGQVDYDIHCSGEPSLLYRISEHGLSVRHSYAKATALVRALGRQDSDDTPLLVMFMGAGASITKGMPLGDQLRNEALARATGQPVDSGTFQSVARNWYQELNMIGRLSEPEQLAGIDEFVGSLTLERVLQQEQAEENQTNSVTLRKFAEVHSAVKAKVLAELDPSTDPLALIVAARQRLVLLTVNFDQIIEARCGDNLQTFVTEEEMLAFPTYLEGYMRDGGKVPLVKLHGDIDAPETLVANLLQTSAGLSVARDTAISALITAVDAAPTHPWIYVGYSMRDRDLDQAWSSPKMATFNELWVSPFLDPVVESFISVKRVLSWQRASRAQTAIDRLVSLTAEDFYKAFYELVAQRWPTPPAS